MKRWTYFAIGFSFCAFVVGALVWNVDVSRGVTSSEEYNQKIRDGLAEVNVPRSNNTSSINAAPESLSSFLNYRSGLQISSANKNALLSAEQSAWNTGKRIDANVLSQIITQIALERMPNLSDGEIANITELSRPFNAPGLPVKFQQSRAYVQLRTRGIGRMLADDFSEELRKLRAGGSQTKIAENLISVAVSTEVNRRVDAINKADTTFFVGPDFKMTPTQALLVAYAVVSDDTLAQNEAGLNQQMQNRQQLNAAQANGSGYPSPTGHKAFGDNGYLHSSPISTILNESSIARFLALVQERGN